MIVVERAGIDHHFCQCRLTGMTERRVPHVMRKADRFYQIFIPSECPSQCSSDLRDFKCMSQTSTIIIAFIIYKYLRLIFQSSERSSMDDSIFVPLEARAKGMIFFGELSSF